MFHYHPYISLVLVVLSIFLTLSFKYEKSLETIGATIISTLGFSYFCQQQKLAETQLFKELFTEFNQRYDNLNEILADIRSCENPSNLDPHKSKKIVDYFNLCAEEFLFRDKGYIPDIVWGSWCRGMLENFNNPAIKQAWENEIVSNSYYGLTMQKIKEGATLICN